MDVGGCRFRPPDNILWWPCAPSLWLRRIAFGIPGRRRWLVRHDVSFCLYTLVLALWCVAPAEAADDRGRWAIAHPPPGTMPPPTDYWTPGSGAGEDLQPWEERAPRQDYLARVVEARRKSTATGGWASNRPGRHLQSARAREPEVEILDFSRPGEDSVEDEGEVIMGNIRIEGKFEEAFMDDVAENAKNTIIKVCYCDHPLCDADTQPRIYWRMRVDIETFGTANIGLFIDYYVQAPLGANGECSESLAIAGYGPEVPPYGVVAAPAYRIMFEQMMASNVKTFAMDPYDWRVVLPLPSCVTRRFLRKAVQPTAPPPEDPNAPEKSCGNFSESGMDSARALTDKHVEWVSPGSLCEFAKSGCTCMVIPGCAYVNATSGGKRCISQPTNPYVLCQDCPTMAQCPIDPADLCASKVAPCECALTTTASREGCRWTEATQTCRIMVKSSLGFYDDVERTSCKECPLQWHCNLPAQEGEISPRAGLVLPSDEAGSMINVTFDRQMRLQRIPGTQYINFNAVAFYCRRPPPSLPKVHDVPANRLRWLNTSAGGRDQFMLNSGFGNILEIDVNGTLNAAIVDCDLVISGKAIEDLDSVPFLGMGTTQANRYSFAFADTLGPEVAELFPKNGASGVSVDSEITIVFDEEIRPSTNNEVVIYGFGGAAEAAFVQALEKGTQDVTAMDLGPADKVLATLRLPDSAYLGRSITVDLQGFELEHEKLYSIELVPNTARDVAGNTFGGIPQGSYAFRTGAKIYIKTTSPEPEPKEEVLSPDGVLILIVVAIFLGIVWCGSVVGCIMLYKVTRAQARVTVGIDEDKQRKKTEDDVFEDKVDQWDGSFLTAHLQAEDGTLAFAAKAKKVNCVSESLHDSLPCSTGGSRKSVTSSRRRGWSEPSSPVQSPKSRKSQSATEWRIATHKHDSFVQLEIKESSEAIRSLKFRRGNVFSAAARNRSSSPVGFNAARATVACTSGDMSPVLRRVASDLDGEGNLQGGQRRRIAQGAVGFEEPVSPKSMAGRLALRSAASVASKSDGFSPRRGGSGYYNDRRVSVSQGSPKAKDIPEVGR